MSNQSATGEFFKEITLDSSQARTGTLNRPVFYFDNFMDDLDFVHVSRVILPTTYYVFSSPSYVSMTINGQTATWPAGNYTSTEWIAVLQSTSAATAVALTVSYSNVTGRLTFSGNTTLTLGFGTTQRVWELLGFNAGNNTNGTSTITAPNVANFSGPNYAVLRARMASVFNGTSIYFSEILNDTSAEDRFIMVPIDQNRNSVVFYTSIPNRYFEWFDTQTRSMEFYFTLGTRSETLDFNGASFQIQLAGYARGTMYQQKLAQNVRHLQR